MLIPITISGQKYNIKSIDELTTREFIEVASIENLDIIKYIAWQTGLKFESAFFATYSKSVEKAIGKLPDITKLKRSEQFDYSKIIDTVGQRHQIENCGKTGFPLLVFSLAVSQARSNNSEQVEELESSYYEMPFKEILPAGFFFFTSYKNGNKIEHKLLNLLRCLMTIPKRKNRRVLTA